MRSWQKGFTLIEMLVAMAIFSALITVLMLGYRQGLLMWEKDQQQSHIWLDYDFRYRLLDTLVSQAVVSDDECAEKTFSPYFVGSQHLMKFISSTPLMDVSGRVEHVVIEAARQDGGNWSVRYREGRNQGNGWVVLLDDLQKVSFVFEAPIRKAAAGMDMSWWSDEDKSLYRDKAEWLTDYDACKLRVYPQQLKMNFTDIEGGVHSWLFAPPQQADAWSMGAYFIDG